MFTDIVGSTEMTARLGDSAALELVRAHDALVRRGLEAYGGREIKHTGDGIMASFDNVANSVRAAADIQRRFAAYNADASETLSVRIGIDAGEPVEDHSDLFGSTVQLAARLCSEAEANGIIVSGFARELCQEDAARFVALGERRFKGFADKAQVFRFEWRDQIRRSRKMKDQFLALVSRENKGSNNDAGASRPYLLRTRKAGDLPLSSCADDDSLCAWVAIAGRSGRSHDVQSTYPVDAVSAEQYLRGLAHRCASLDADP
jgi:hypothetical protein